MRASALIELSVTSDLRQTALSDIGVENDRTAEQQKNIDAVLGFVNQGVLELYKRFPIQVNIDDVFVLSPSTSDDSVALPDNSLALIRITNSIGEEVPTDDYNTEYLYKTKAYKDVYVKSLAINKYLVLGEIPSTGVTLQFHYTTAPDTIRYTSEIPLPVIFQEALLMYVAYRGYSTVKSVTEAGDESFAYRKKFEDSCAKIEQHTDTLFEWANPNRLRERCFV